MLHIYAYLFSLLYFNHLYIITTLYDHCNVFIILELLWVFTAHLYYLFHFCLLSTSLALAMLTYVSHANKSRNSIRESWSWGSVHKHEHTPQSPRTAAQIDPTKSWENKKIITWHIGKNEQKSKLECYLALNREYTMAEYHCDWPIMKEVFDYVQTQWA